MPVMGAVTGGKAYQVTFKSRPQTGGPSVVTLSWTPAEGSTVPKTERAIVFPGRTKILEGTAPAKTAAYDMFMILNVPDGEANCELVVVSDGKQVTKRQVKKDKEWTWVVL